MSEGQEPLPQTLRVVCCLGKSCGYTKIYLETMEVEGLSEPLYDYARGNGNSYMGGWVIEPVIRRWLERHKGDLSPE